MKKVILNFKGERHELTTEEEKIKCELCGKPGEELFEGFCNECCQEYQAGLDREKEEYDYWQRMSAEDAED